MSRPVAEFYSAFGINVRTEDLKKVDRYLGLAERRLKRFQEKVGRHLNLRFDKFSVNSAALRRVLSTSLDRASRNVTFEISRFAVNEARMRNALMRASRRVN